MRIGRSSTVAYVVGSLAMLVAFAASATQPLSVAANRQNDKSDLNGDRIVNERDLMLFSEQYPGVHFMEVDWCRFEEGVKGDTKQFGKSASYYQNQYFTLLQFIEDKYKCHEVPPAPPPVDPLALENPPRFLTRIAAARDFTGNFYVTDGRIGSVFICDADLHFIGELKGPEKPLGIAVNSAGQILVGDDARNRVEVYSPESGELLSSFGEAEIEMPVAITVDSADRVYVTDARSNTVYVYDSAHALIETIGEPGEDAHQLLSPMDAVLSPQETEVFVVDRNNRRIQVYDLAGTHIRTINKPAATGGSWWTCMWGGCEPEASFTRLQAIDVDSFGRLHVLDIFDVQVTVLDPQSGAVIDKYGAYGTDSGELKSPMDVLVDLGRVLVVDGGLNKVEVYPVP